MSETILELNSVTKRFGGLVAVDGVSFTVEKGQIRAIIGPNGAGKTTIFNLISGIYPVSGGELLVGGRKTRRLASHQVARLGLARTFQNVELFAQMSVLDNVMVGAHTQGKAGLLSAAVRMPGMIREERRLVAWARECLELVGIDAADYGRESGELAFGQQRLLEVARALAARPRLLLLDEPAAGLSTAETAKLSKLVQRIRDTGVTVLLVDHDMDLVMRISDQVVVLDSGQKIADGTPREVQRDPRVIAAYLGEEI